MASAVLAGIFTRAEAATAWRCSSKTVSKWVRRYSEGGPSAMVDRSSAPHRVANKTPTDVEAAVETLRRQRFTAAEIGTTLGLAVSTVTAVCRRIGLNRLSRLEPVEPPNRYERRRPGELIHIDVKKLGRIGRPGHRVNGDRTTRSRGIGWECVHVAVDDATRLAYVEVLANEQAEAVAGFLRRAVTFFADRGVVVERVMTDNGSGYRRRLHALACAELGLRHLRTRPYRPGPTAKRSASSRPCSGAGPTPPPTRPATSAPVPSDPGSSATTTSDPTAPLASAHPPLGSPSCWNNLPRNYS